MRCDQCKHWNNQDVGKYHHEWDAGRLGLGECHRVSMLYESTKFKKKEDALEGKERHISTDQNDLDDGVILVEIDGTQKMYTQDGSSYRATLYTKPDFFCAHFEARTEPLYQVQGLEGRRWRHAFKADKSIEEAWSTLAYHKKEYPSKKHRLVEIAPNGNIKIIPDNSKELEKADKAFSRKGI